MGYSEIHYEIRDLFALHKKLTDFIIEAETEKNRMRESTASLQNYWRDNQYRRFAAYMDGLTSDIDMTLKKLTKTQADLMSYITDLMRPI